MRKTGRVIHGATVGKNPTPEYQVYLSMIDRCENPNNNRYRCYGGRGIKVCKRWRKSFVNFLSDMGYRPIQAKRRQYSIDRIDSDRDYTPSNCRWADSLTQMNNTSRSRFIEFNGESLTIAQWARKVGMTYAMLYLRIDRSKWSIEKALTHERMVNASR